MLIIFNILYVVRHCVPGSPNVEDETVLLALDHQPGGLYAPSRQLPKL